MGINKSENDNSINELYYIFCKIKQNYDTIMTETNLEIINNNSMKKKFMDMGYNNEDANCVTLAFVFYLYKHIFVENNTKRI